MRKQITEWRIYVGPERDDTITAAVQAAGARVVDEPDTADAFVWLSPSTTDLSNSLHPDVEWVQLKSAGIDHLLRSGLVDDRRHWTGARGAYAGAVAEHGLTLMLAAARRLHEILPARDWGEPGTRFGHVLAGACVGIVGCGAIGRSLIDLLDPFETRVLAVTRSGQPVAGAAETVTPAHADAVVARSDFLVLSAPATPETVGFMDRRRLALMPRSAWLVNIGRGDLVITDDLVEALEGRSIGGAALDVTDPEPLPDDHALWKAPNAIITPHTANPPETNSVTLADRVVENLLRFEQGAPLLGTIDVARGY